MKTMYVFERYSDKGGIGEEKLFSTAVEAIEYAENDWQHLTDKERKLEDVFRVYEVKMTDDQISAYEDGELDEPVSELWNADVKIWR